VGKSGFHALAGSLKQVRWPDKFKTGNIDRYWDQLCAMFIKNFQGTYEHPYIAETLNTIRQKHDESLRDYVKHFYNGRNDISYIQDIEIINAFRDVVSDIKTVEEIALKKPKTMVDLLTVADVCIEASEAQA
jgi:hypothetical protein